MSTEILACREALARRTNEAADAIALIRATFVDAGLFGIAGETLPAVVGIACAWFHGAIAANKRLLAAKQVVTALRTDIALHGRSHLTAPNALAALDAYDRGEDL